MKPAVLVIENDRATRKLLDVLLSRIGLVVDLVPTGSDALLLLEQVDYDLVFIDLTLADLSGTDVLEWIEEHDRPTLARCVVLSSAAPAQLESIRTRWQMVRTIRKPFELSEVMEVAQAAASEPARRSGSAIEQFTRRSVSAGAKSGVIMNLDGEHLVPSMWFGYKPGVVESYLPIHMDVRMPVTLAVREARPVWLATLAGAHEYPQLADTWERLGTRALAAVPVLRDGVVVGAAGWAFREGRLFHEPEQQLFRSIAGAAFGVESAEPPSS
jgi:CheY-like chemotaxis protein